MKNKILSTLLVFVGIYLSGCKDSFLDRTPESSYPPTISMLQTKHLKRRQLHYIIEHGSTTTVDPLCI